MKPLRESDIMLSRSPLLCNYILIEKANGSSFHTITKTLNKPRMQAHAWARGTWTPGAVHQLCFKRIVPTIVKSRKGRPPLPHRTVEWLIGHFDHDWEEIASFLPGYHPEEMMALWDWYLVTRSPIDHRFEWLPSRPYTPREDVIIRHGVTDGLSNELISVEVNYDNTMRGLPMRSPTSIRNRRKILRI